MSHELPSFLEDHIAQIPALQLLQNLGWEYLTPAEAVSLRAQISPRGGSSAARLMSTWVANIG